MLEILIGSSHTGVVHMSIASLSLCVQQPCHVQNTIFHRIPSILALTFSSPLLPWCSPEFICISKCVICNIISAIMGTVEATIYLSLSLTHFHIIYHFLFSEIITNPLLLIQRGFTMSHSLNGALFILYVSNPEINTCIYFVPKL